MKKQGGFTLFGLFALGFGAIVGVGWSVTLNNFMITGGGPLPAALGFALATVVLVPVTLCFAELTPAMPVAGGIIAYAYRAYNTTVSFVAGWFLAMAYISILPWEAIAINDILSYIFPALKSGIILYTIGGVDIYGRAVLVGLGLSLIIALLNWRGVKAAVKFQKALTLCLIVYGLVCMVFALVKMEPGNLLPAYAQMPGKSHTSFLTGVLATFAVAPFFFSGFDTIAQGAEDAGSGIKPASLGKIIIGTLVCAGLFYVLIIMSAGLACPWLDFIQLERPVFSNLFVKLYGGAAGNILSGICLLGTLAGLLSTWNGFYIAAARLILGMGRARLLPAFFARKHPKYDTPLGGNILCALVMMTGPFLGSGLIDPLTVLGSAGFTIGWLICCLSALRLRKTSPELPRPYKMPAGKLVAAVGVVICTFLFINCIMPGMPGYLGDAGLIVFIVWSLLGLCFYITTRKNRTAENERERMEAVFGPASAD